MADNEMIERVAKAISLSFHEEGYIEGISDPHEWNEFLKAAKAAIEAMREPTDQQRNNYYKLAYSLETFFDARWERAIDAILKE